MGRGFKKQAVTFQAKCPAPILEVLINVEELGATEIFKKWPEIKPKLFVWVVVNVAIYLNWRSYALFWDTSRKPYQWIPLRHLLLIACGAPLHLGNRCKQGLLLEGQMPLLWLLFFAWHIEYREFPCCLLHLWKQWKQRKADKSVWNLSI